MISQISDELGVIFYDGNSDVEQDHQKAFQYFSQLNHNNTDDSQQTL